MDPEVFSGDLLASGHDPFSIDIQTDGEFISMNGLHDACDDFSHPLVVILKLGPTLRLPDTLLDDLPCCLSCHPAKVTRGALHHHQIA
jgi:hypothetical protein